MECVGFFGWKRQTGSRCDAGIFKIKMTKQYSNFHFRKIFSDGKMLEIKLNNSSLAEQLICLKLAEHIILALKEYMNFKQEAERKQFVDNFIRESMEKLKCQKKN